MDTLRRERDGPVAIVTLTRPPANAMDTASLDELAGAFDGLTADDSVAAVVLTGEGTVCCPPTSCS